MTSCAWEWRWSSAAARIGLAPSDIPLDWLCGKSGTIPRPGGKCLNLDYAGQRLQSAYAKQQSAAVRSGRLPFWRTWNCASGDPSDRSGEVENPSPGAEEGLPNCAME
jgi:hypothetical protein